MKIYRSALMSILTGVLLVFTLSGCNHTNTHNTFPADNNETEPVESEVSQASISVGSIITGLAKAALGKIGDDVYGYVMHYLGYGDPGNEEEVKYLHQISSELKHIEVELKVIQIDLNKTINDLGLSEDETLGAIYDPHKSVSTINGKAIQFGEYIGQNPMPGSVDKEKLHDFAYPLVNSMDSINIQIQFINDAILNHEVFTTLTYTSFDQYSDKSKSIIDAYNALEYYTSTLIYAEAKGANLYVESTIYLYDNNQTSISDFEKDGDQELVNFMDNIQKNLRTQIGDYNQSDIYPLSYMYNVWGLALWTMNPLPYKEGANYFNKSQPFLKRADIYRMSALSKKFSGLRMLFFVTDDISHDDIPQSLTAVNLKSKTVYELGCRQVSSKVYSFFKDNGTDQTKGLKEYDYWYEGNKVKPSSKFSAYVCETATDGENIETGRYTVELTPSLFEAEHLPEIEVIKYDENYTQSADGNVTYGFAASVLRTPMNNYKENSSFLGSQKPGLIENVAFRGSENNWPFSVEISGDDGNDYYAGQMEVDAYFNYEGLDNKKIYVDYGATFSGYNYNTDQGWNYSQGISRMQIGVWDMTAKKFACKDHYNKKYYTDTERKNFKYSPRGVCSFNAKKGHGYYVYFLTFINGQDLNDKSHLQLDSIDYVHVHF